MVNLPSSGSVRFDHQAVNALAFVKAGNAKNENNNNNYARNLMAISEKITTASVSIKPLECGI